MPEQSDLFSYSPHPHYTQPAALPDDIPGDVAELFEKFALQLIATGRSHYSSDAILHRIRWYHHVERRDGDFKCNDHWTAALSRWFMAKHPQHLGFFETRIRKSERSEN